MKKITIVSQCLSLTLLSVSLTACIYGSANKTAFNPDSATAKKEVPVAPMPANTTKLSVGDPIGGYLEQYMDANDKSKLSRAMDAGLGKETSWDNPINGATFTVKPIRKAQVEGAKFCRSYSVTMEKDDAIDVVTGTACIGEDGNWKTV